MPKGKGGFDQHRGELQGMVNDGGIVEPIVKACKLVPSKDGVNLVR